MARAAPTGARRRTPVALAVAAVLATLSPLRVLRSSTSRVTAGDETPPPATSVPAVTAAREQLADGRASLAAAQAAVEDAEVVAAITAPSATDADGKPVPTGLQA